MFLRRAALPLAALAIAISILYFYGLTATGMVGPDEPRYAAIGRAMAHSGDWVTPRLWGDPWFEKPPLLYWMTALGTLAGLGPDLAPRLPVALLSIVFLGFFYWMLRREFGPRPAIFATLILATSAGWMAYSLAAVTDLPLSVFFSAAMLLLLPWLRDGERRLLPAAAFCLALAVLAKSLVPIVLALPVVWFGRRHLRDLARPAVVATFLIVTLPWHILCEIRNGPVFFQTLFVQHQFGRFASDALQHVQPFWYFVPALAAALFPWFFLTPLLFQRPLFEDSAPRFLLALSIFGFVFFSASRNKLPGYILPILPLLAALLGLALHRARFAGGWLALVTLMLGFIPVLGWMLPTALASGVRHAYPVDLAVRARAALLMPLFIVTGGVEAFADRAGKRNLAFGLAFAAALVCAFWLKVTALPRIDAAYSARPVWRALQAAPEPCAPPMNRTQRYGLNYYFDRNLPDCK